VTERTFARRTALAVGLLLVVGGISAEARARRVAETPAEPQTAASEGGESIPEPVTPRLVLPVAGVSHADLRNDYGAPRSGSRRHTAIDILAPRGTPVVAASDGTILKLYRSRAGGLTIYLADAASEVVYYYAHLDRYAESLSEGMMVERGSVIGYVGSTGNATTPHLHFGVELLPAGGNWWKGKPVNPFPILQDAEAVPLPAR
jgi:peptidoglycan LD-endopeptidase LytH